MKISCLLLAAGHSSRMGGVNKLLLKIGAQSLVKRTLSEINNVGLNQVIVVTGHDQVNISKELEGMPAEIVFNKDFKKGMHSSIRAGLMVLEKCDAFFICPADHPSFDRKILMDLIEKLSPALADPILFPTHHGKRGQPVLISSKYIPEILNQVDGDFGCSYLFDRHPQQCLAIPVNSPGIFQDIDHVVDYKNLLQDSNDPVEDFYSFITGLRAQKRSFITATVIEVMGSASARVGSKAVFDEAGKNLMGWVGGGCAERFIGEECVRALEEKRPRIVLADLDDEIFGLGVACGGKMRVFLDPIIPAETITLPSSEKFKNEVRSLAGFYGLNVRAGDSMMAPDTIEELLLSFVKALAELRKVSSQSLRIVKEAPAHFRKAKVLSRKKQVTIVGRTRITEALARHFTLLDYSVRAIGPAVDSADYPSTVACSCIEDGYGAIDFQHGEVVIVAGHTSQDPQIVEKALNQGASHVAMVGSYKRSVEVLTHLDLINSVVDAPLYVPAGLDIDAKNPEEIALSITAEVILAFRGEL